MAVVACTRPAQDQSSQRSSMVNGGTYEVPPLTELRQLKTAGRGSELSAGK